MLVSSETGFLLENILRLFPTNPNKHLGQRKEANGDYSTLDLPEWHALQWREERNTRDSCMKRIEKYLLEVIKANPSSFRTFSPDELVSNKLDAFFDGTGRNFKWDEAARSSSGRVKDILSKHICEEMLQGYTLTGRTGRFPSCEWSNI